jgi:predicted AlkP superfamily phosphohydrolase/phosphomutase
MSRTLFIGLDGATFTVLDQLTQEIAGEGITMPFMRRVLQNGFRTVLRSTPHPLTPPAWTSIMTGRSPGHHGVHDFVRFDDRGHEVFFTLYDSRDIRTETIWSIASRHNMTVASLNFPMMAPVFKVNGSLVPGFVSWKHLRLNVYPPALYGRLKAIEGFDPKKLAWDFERESQVGEVMTQAELEAWVNSHMPREEQWFQIARTLLENDDPDLFAVMFDGTDKLQHQVWHVLDPSRLAEGLNEDDRRLRKMVLEYFRTLDSYIERLVQLAGPNAQVFFASDHGFTGAQYVFRVNGFLAERGYLSWHKTDGSAAEKRREDANFAYLDWTQTTAYCPTPSSNGIVIRVARKPGDPGISPDQYEAFRARLIDHLMSMKHPETGGPFIREILSRDEVFVGAARDAAPDLTLVLHDYGFVSVRNRRPILEKRRLIVGTHHPDGIFLAAGKGIEMCSAESTMAITDVAAVLLYSLGIPIPEDFEGRVRDEIFSADHLMRFPVQYGAASRNRDELEKPEGTVSAHDKEKILDQLRALGYLEE